MNCLKLLEIYVVWNIDMNINTENMAGCHECFWMGRVDFKEQERCPACDDKYGLYDANYRYDSRHHELIELTTYEVYLEYQYNKRKYDAKKYNKKFGG